MANTQPDGNGADPGEIEVQLDDGTHLELQRVEVAAEFPVSFTVHGLIHDVREDVLAQFKNRTVTPTAVRFEVTNE